MKKLAVYLMSLLMLVCLAAPISAEENDFTPSVTYKPSPEVVAVGTSEDGQKIVGEIVDASGNVLAVVYDGCTYVTSLEEALDEESQISESVRKLLVDVYNQFLNNEIKLSDISAELNEAVATALGEGNTADNLVIRDLFDIDITHEDCKNHLDKEGTTVDLVLDVDIEKGTFFTVIRYVDGQWQVVEEVVNNNDNDNPEDDGTITITAEKLCPVAILVPGTLASVDTPVETPASSFNMLWVIVPVVIAGIGWVVSKKGKKA